MDGRARSTRRAARCATRARYPVNGPRRAAANVQAQPEPGHHRDPGRRSRNVGQIRYGNAALRPDPRCLRGQRRCAPRHLRPVSTYAAADRPSGNIGGCSGRRNPLADTPRHQQIFGRHHGGARLCVALCDHSRGKRCLGAAGRCRVVAVAPVGRADSAAGCPAAAAGWVRRAGRARGSP